MKLPKKKVIGKLPTYSWIRKYGLERGINGLNECMQKHPELFIHIDQEFNGYRGDDYYVELAEKLTKENNGILPFLKEIKRLGHAGLCDFIRKNPEKISHLERITKQEKNIRKNVKKAESLAKDNGGILPTYAYLRRNGHNDINECRRRNSERFKHIEQESGKGKTIKEWVKFAEKLEKEKGKLPSISELRRIKLTSLAAAISIHPKEFKGMKQEYKNGVRIIG